MDLERLLVCRQTGTGQAFGRVERRRRDGAAGFSTERFKMKKTNHLRCQWLSFAVMMTIAMGAMTAAGKEAIVLGPPESGTWSGSEKWLTGAYGAATTSFDLNDTSKGTCAFVLSNTVAGKENTADWRCAPFSLGPAAGGGWPVTFSFAYKLSDRVAAKNNIHVQLRFFDATGTNFIGERVIPVGAHTGDSAMTEYRTLTINDIPTPPRARMADIWIDANIFEPWVSGTARFDDFSVTTVPRPIRFKVLIGAAVLLGICALTLLLIHLGRRNAGRQ
jgi:hypothetical protein